MKFINSAFIRILDILLASGGLLLLWPVILVLYAVIFLDTGSPLFRQKRVGRNQQLFVILKFRTMKLDTLNVPSHLLGPESITFLGKTLRRFKLDELPQLWNVLIGDMSMVGPRPGLPNHHELVKSRATYGIYSARPGITGLAQINKIDMSNPTLLAQTDKRMLEDLNFVSYFKYIFMTIAGKGLADAVKEK